VEAGVLDSHLQLENSTHRAKHLARIPGARLVGVHGLVVLPDGAVAAESVYDREVMRLDPDFPPSRRPRVIEKQGTYFSLLNIWALHGHYYHWFNDNLTRLCYAMEALPDDVQYLVPPRMQQFQRDSLALLGIPEARVLPKPGSEVWELETLFLATASSSCGATRPDSIEWLRGRLLRGARVAGNGRHRRIYISRQDAPGRRVSNDRDVEALLHSYGFESCVAAHLSLREQVALFSTAEAIVAAHGAGLTNMLYAPPGALVVEMVDTKSHSVGYIYWTMAEALGHEYWYFTIDSIADGHSERPDTFVPIEKLQATLDAAGLTSAS
jgi:capsular polysaccharide biosynthesis protein